MSTNHTPVELKPVIAALEGLSPDLLATVCQTDAAKVLLAALTRPPASAAPVDELVEKADRIYERCKFWPETSADGMVAPLELRNFYHDSIRDQLTIYARRVAELEAEVERLQQAPTEADPSYASMRAALTGEQG